MPELKMPGKKTEGDGYEIIYEIFKEISSQVSELVSFLLFRFLFILFVL